MAVREIVLYGHPALRRPAEQVTKITPEIFDIIRDLKDTLAMQRGIGLAAPQIGIPLQIFIADLTGMEDKKYAACKGVFINPEILSLSKTEERESEGCLSFPDVRGFVSRPFKVKMRGMLPSGALRTVEASGYYARCLLHEYDHLHGKLFIDRFDEADIAKTAPHCQKFLELGRRTLPEVME